MNNVVLRLLALTGAALFVCGNLRAQELPKTSLVVHTISRHSRNCGGCIPWNEENTGFGVRYAAGNFAAQAGFFRNSFARQTNYVIADYLPARLGGFSAGGFAGAATGYITDPLLVGGLTVRYEVSRFGAAVRYLPQKGEGTVAVYALEFSYAL